jgi:hypothetical protein
LPGVDVAFMLLKRHGWDIHAFSRGPDQGGGRGSAVTETSWERWRTRGRGRVIAPVRDRRNQSA